MTHRKFTTALILLVLLTLLLGTGCDSSSRGIVEVVKSEKLVESGINHYDDGEYDEAQSSFKRAALEMPDSAEPFYWIARTFEAQGEVNKAIKYYDAAIERNPTYIEAMDAAAVLTTQKADWENTLRYRRRIVELNPTDAISQNNLGFVYLAVGDYERAEPVFQKAINLNDDLGRSWNGLGLVYDAQGKTTDAVEALENSVTADPERMDSQVHLGLVYEKAGEPAAASTAYTRALNIEKTGPLAELAATRLVELGYAP